MQKLKQRPGPLQNVTLTSASTFFSPHPSIRLEQTTFPSVESAECDTQRLFQVNSVPSDSDQPIETDPLNSTFDQSIFQSKSFILGPKSSDVQSLCTIIDNLSKIIIHKNKELKHYQSNSRPLRSMSLDYSKPSPATPRDADDQSTQHDSEIGSAMLAINSISLQERERKENLSQNIMLAETNSGIREKSEFFEDNKIFEELSPRKRRETMPSNMGKRILKERKNRKELKRKKDKTIKFGKKASKLRSSFYSERMDASDTMMKMINLGNPLGPEFEDDHY